MAFGSPPHAPAAPAWWAANAPKKLGGFRNKHRKSPTFLIEKNLQNKVGGFQSAKKWQKKPWVSRRWLWFFWGSSDLAPHPSNSRDESSQNKKKKCSTHLSPTLQPKLGISRISPRNWHNYSVLQILLQLLSWRWKELRVPAKILIPGLPGVSEAVVRGVGKPFKIQNHRVLSCWNQGNQGRSEGTPNTLW